VGAELKRSLFYFQFANRYIYMARRVPDARAEVPITQPSDFPGGPQDPAGEAEVAGQRVADDELNRLIKAHHRPLVNFLRVRRKQSLEDAKDLAQETFMRVWRILRAKGVRLEASYLYQTALNRSTDLHRQRARFDAYTANILTDVATSPTEVEDVAMTDQQIRELRNYLAELPQSHQSAFRLWHIEGKPQREIALEMGVTSRTITNYISEATCYCRHRLDGASASTAKSWMRK
jgi:RNA polymerase sigma factor (sigma-70 family)